MQENGFPGVATRLSCRSRAMLERYSHIRMAAKRYAVESLSITGRGIKAGNSEVVPHKSPHRSEIRTKVTTPKRLKRLVSAVGIEPTTY